MIRTSATISAVASTAIKSLRNSLRCTAIGQQRLSRKRSFLCRPIGITGWTDSRLVASFGSEGMGTNRNAKSTYSTAVAVPKIHTFPMGKPRQSILNATALRWCSDSSANTATNSATATTMTTTTPLDVEALQSDLVSIVPEMARGLAEDGYYTTTDILPESTVRTLREQSIALRFEHGRFEQSYSETIDASTGKVKERFDKEGVYACEPDGRDYYDATDLITYMSIFLKTLPEALNLRWEWELQQQQQQQQQQHEEQSPASTPHSGLPLLPALSNESFNAKLAVTEHGGAKYPLHVDNPQGLAVGDTRKLTCILYLNPDHTEDDGGEIRLYLPFDSGNNNDNDDNNEGNNEDNDSEDAIRTVDLSPAGGRLLVFWSDEIPHEVLPTSSTAASPSNAKDRYALTIWIPTSNVLSLHNASSRFGRLNDLVFPEKQQ